MKKSILYALWGGLFILCAGLGFIPEPAGILRSIMTFFALLTFVPPGLLLFQAIQNKDRNTIKLIRHFSLLSLILTVLLLILNFLSAGMSEVLGSILYYTLVIVTSPMICSGHWAMSLFAWACLLMITLRELKKK